MLQVIALFGVTLAQLKAGSITKEELFAKLSSLQVNIMLCINMAAADSLLRNLKKPLLLPRPSPHLRVRLGNFCAS